MDDDEMVILAIGEMLRHLGYEVVFAGDGSEAIELYIKARMSEQPFDIVIMDLIIKKGMGGIEAIKKLLAIDKNCKAIVSSGYYQEPVMAEYWKYGFLGALPKPYGIKEMEKALSSIINLRQGMTRDDR